MPFYWTSWVSLAALLLYFWTVALVGRARGKYQVKAPSVDGPDAFRRTLRVQLNTLEQLALFLPALWLCALWQNDHAAAAGVVWVAGRIWYALAYLQDAAKRSSGFLLASAALFVLLAGLVAGLFGWVI